jgi:hypothetical protein
MNVKLSNTPHFTNPPNVVGKPQAELDCSLKIVFIIDLKAHSKKPFFSLSVKLVEIKY